MMATTQIRPNAGLYDLLVALLAYPDDGWRRRFENARRNFTAAAPEAAQFLALFLRETGAHSTEQMQELFTSTFDMNPACSLEVGWHLFGEDYARGKFLVRMRQEMRKHGVEESSELPDHLAHVLAVLGRMDQPEADELAQACVLPALEKMLSGVAGRNNPYENVLKAVRSVLETRHRQAEPAAARLPEATVSPEVSV